MAKGSNFAEELNKAFSLETMDEVKSISFEFKGEIVRVDSADKKEMVLRRELAPIFKKKYRVNKVFSKVMKAQKEPSFVNPVVKSIWDSSPFIFEGDNSQKKIAEYFIGYIQYVFENRKAVNFKKIYKSIVECLLIANSYNFYSSDGQLGILLFTLCFFFWDYGDKFRECISNDDKM